MRLAIFCCLAVVFGAVSADRACAQYGGRTGRYQPATPTVSPYLNLLRRDGGRLPNYFSFVRPQQRQESFNRQQQTQLNSQASRVNGLSNQLIEAEQGAIKATGSGSRFMNYSHYYPTPNQGASGRRQR